LNVIQVENISKLYRLGQVGTGSIFNDVNRWWHGVRGKEDPYMRVGEENDRTQKGKGDYVWALKDINFEVAQGEVLGIIGRNGAGKSTLLKILSRTTAPTTGTIKVKGRIASLLEVGTGFHPELSGRDNIFMNGTILGMTRSEIKSKFDEIVEFAGVARYLDTPVKRYSSGMYVRLAFAVAAHLESEILIVDEVLAVGDMEFQKKCLGKMKDVSERQGRTVLFVSHNMNIVNSISDKTILIHNGKKSFLGPTGEAINEFVKCSNKENPVSNFSATIKIESDEFVLNEIVVSQNNQKGLSFINTLPVKIKLDYEIKSQLIGFRIGFDLVDRKTDTTLFRSFHDDLIENVSYVLPGRYISSVDLPVDLLKEGVYSLNILVGIHNQKWISKNELNFNFNIVCVGGVNSAYGDKRPGYISPHLEWLTSSSDIL
jgi:lipopolysaccharide transport system ATP-binding protein